MEIRREEEIKLTKLLCITGLMIRSSASTMSCQSAIASETRCARVRDTLCARRRYSLRVLQKGEIFGGLDRETGIEYVLVTS